MKPDKLKQYVALRESLQNEKAALEARLAQINKALGDSSRTTPSARSSNSVGRKRAKNAMSLKEAITKVTSARPLTKAEIKAELKRIGYKFMAHDPSNSINVVLYSKANKFRNEDGKFSPAK